jgi:hypothetical protein
MFAPGVERPCHRRLLYVLQWQQAPAAQRHRSPFVLLVVRSMCSLVAALAYLPGRCDAVKKAA